MSCIHLFATGLGAASGVAVLGSGLVWTFSACHASLSLSCFSAHARCSENANLCFTHIWTSFQAAAQSKSVPQKVNWDNFLISERPVLIPVCGNRRAKLLFPFSKATWGTPTVSAQLWNAAGGFEAELSDVLDVEHHIWGKSEANPINKAVIFRFPYLELLFPESFLL